MEKMNWRILPHSALGRWSDGLIAAMLILLLIGTSLADSVYESIQAGGTILEDIAARPVLALTMLAGMAAGVAAFFTGISALFRKKDHSLLVIASSLVGGLLILYLIAEVAFPH